MAHQDVDMTLVVVEVRPETPQHVSVVMRRPRGFDYDPGDWIDFEFTPALRGGPTYSLSSSPTEADLMITFRQGHSDIKRLLEGAPAGTELRISSYGNDDGFTLDENRASMLVAGGVGVAPFRSMVKHMADTDSRNEVDLIYLNKGPDFLFENELLAWRKTLPGLRLPLLNTHGVDRKTRERLLRDTIRADDLHVYLAGPRAMVESTRTFLTGEGVPRHLIRVDEFGGY